MKKIVSVLLSAALLIFLLIFLKNLPFRDEEKTPFPKLELLTLERLEEYFESCGMDWKVKEEKGEENEEILSLFTVSDKEENILFRVSNVVNPDIEGYSLNLFSYVKPLSLLPDADEETEKKMMDVAVDLSGIHLEEEALGNLHSFKEKMILADRDSFRWHTEDQHYIMMFNYSRDRKSSDQFRLMDIKVWNDNFFRELQTHLVKALLRTADTKNQENPVEMSTLKEMAAEIENSAGEKPKENRIYLTVGRFKYAIIKGWTAFDEYISLGGSAVDPNLYETGYLYDDEAKIKVLIPKFYRKYPIDDALSYRFLLNYSEKANLYIVKTMDEDTQ